MSSESRQCDPLSDVSALHKEQVSTSTAGTKPHLVLGPLEKRVLELLWSYRRAVTVRHVRLKFPHLAYTTLMTTLDRLYRKGVLLRRRHGRAFVYEPRCSQDVLLSEIVSSHVADLLAAHDDNAAILSTLVHVVGRKDAALLDELDALIQAERTRLKLEAT
ncbi:MAG TPA: BlaI/MecI/CopY family transcriptional regulator [Steroidobacteraceae bacterium]|nr:BlaI/MecI/CopY family transcriptional regulator [Steroidobacteraceae bacterium]